MPETILETIDRDLGVGDPNHHLWRNGRLWWVAFTVHLPGWRKDRGTQQGASRSSPPFSESAASATDFTFDETVCKSLTDRGGAMRVGPRVPGFLCRVLPANLRNGRQSESPECSEFGL